MAANHLLDLARDGEPERALAALLAREPVRETLLALAAFGAELRRIPEQVSEPAIGEIRLRWWHDVIEGFAPGISSGHPVADSLGAAVLQRRLPVKPLLTAIEARAIDLYDDPLPDQIAFDAYLNATEGSLFALSLHAATGREPDPAHVTAAAQAYGRARMLQHLPDTLRRGRCQFPPADLDRHKISIDDLATDPLGEGARRWIEAQARRALEARTRVRSLAAGLPRAHRIPLLPVATVPTLLARLVPRRLPHLRAPIHIDPLKRISRIATAHLLGL